MRTKVKLTKQQIKEDKFTNYMLLTRDWFLDNWQIVAILAAVVALIIAGSVYYFRMKSSKDIEAATRLTKAVAEMRRQNFQVAILELKTLSDEYGGDIGGMALFNLGNAYYDSKNYDEAINSFKNYIDNYKLDKLTTASAYGGIAVSLECKQDFLAAGDKYVEAVKYYPESPSAPDYYLGAVRTYVQGGDRPKAEQMFKELEEKFPGSDYGRTAARLIAQLKSQ